MEKRIGAEKALVRFTIYSIAQHRDGAFAFAFFSPLKVPEPQQTPEC